MDSNIPMSSPDITSEELQVVTEVLQSSVLSIGPYLEKFEAAFSRYEGMAYASGVSSGTAGLHLSMIASEVQEGDFVITTPFSFIASANCILYQRAIPIFVDIDPRTGNVDPHLAAEAIQVCADKNAAMDALLPPNLRGITKRRKTDSGNLKAVIAVHAFGQPCDMNPILSEARKFNISVVEDACEALGAEYQNRKVGSLGDISVFAFYPNKQITTGEGGMLVYHLEDWHKLLCSLRNQGRDMFNAWLVHNRLGYNYRLDEMSAALGYVQFQRLDELLAKRAQVAAWYNERLSENALLELLFIQPETTRMSWFVYIVRLSPEVDRDRLMVKLKEHGVPSRTYFTPIHLQAFYRKTFGYRPGAFLHTENAGKTFLALPFHGNMSEDQVEFVCETLHAELPNSVRHKPNVVYTNEPSLQAL